MSTMEQVQKVTEDNNPPKKNKGGRPKGGPGGPGRPKGVPNKMTTAIKEAILEAFDKAGGVDYLVEVSKLEPKAFCALLGKIVPSEIKAEVNVAGDIVARIQAGRNRVAK